jgi:hypothetical protein
MVYMDADRRIQRTGRYAGLGLVGSAAAEERLEVVRGVCDAVRWHTGFLLLGEKEMQVDPCICCDVVWVMQV